MTKPDNPTTTSGTADSLNEYAKFIFRFFLVHSIFDISTYPLMRLNTLIYCSAKDPSGMYKHSVLGSLLKSEGKMGLWKGTKNFISSLPGARIHNSSWSLASFTMPTSPSLQIFSIAFSFTSGNSFWCNLKLNIPKRTCVIRL